MSGLLDDFRNEFNKPNNTLVQLILINTIVFLLLLVLKVVMVVAEIPGVYGAVIDQLKIPSSLSVFITKPWTMITYFFTHEDVFHILFNMLFLYWFGRLVDEYLGNRRLVALYMLGGIAGGLAYMAIYNLLPYFHSKVDTSEMLGASAAAFSVAVGASTLLPNYTFHLLFFGPVRIKYIAFFYIVLSLARSIGPNAGGELSHLGGALVGFLFIKMLQNGTDLGQPIYWIIDGWQGLFRKKPPVKVSYRQRSSASTHAGTYAAASPSSAVTMPDQDEIDAILDKISRSGYESLTREEKQKLFRASQRG